MTSLWTWANETNLGRILLKKVRIMEYNGWLKNTIPIVCGVPFLSIFIFSIHLTFEIFIFELE